MDDLTTKLIELGRQLDAEGAAEAEVTLTSGKKKTFIKLTVTKK